MSFFLSKFLWTFVVPANLFLIALVCGFLLLRSARSATRKAGMALCATAISVAVTLTLLPLGTWALTPLENRFPFAPPAQVDGLVIIGGDEQPTITEARGQPTALDSMRRYVRFSTLAKQYPHAKLVFAGGSGLLNPTAHMKDSEVAEQALASIGTPTEKMIFERESKNTVENAIFAAQLVKPQPSENWLLVTSAFHMPRAMGCFRKAGWNVYAAPTGYYTDGAYGYTLSLRFDEQLRHLALAVHEYIGLVSYWLMGRIDTVWPG
jgi:uncharacterized SAM-binding protein YcdF (DUF218 family)